MNDGGDSLSLGDFAVAVVLLEDSECGRLGHCWAVCGAVAIASPATLLSSQLRSQCQRSSLSDFHSVLSSSDLLSQWRAPSQ